MRLSSVARSVFALVAMMALGCAYDPTQFLVQIDTNVRDQTVRVGILARRGDSPIAHDAALQHEWQIVPTVWDAGADAGSRIVRPGFPISLGVVPAGGGPRNEWVTVLVTFTTAEPPITLRRILRGRFLPRQLQQLRVYFNRSCLDPSAICSGGRWCRMQEYCEERGQTCDEDGRCGSIVTTIDPMDASTLPTDAASADGDRRDSPPTDVAVTMDSSPGDAPAMCAAGRTLCGGACVDVSSDSNHCGACGSRCTSGMSCSSGRCGCSGGSTNCGGACVDTSNDSSHCGACGSRCNGGTTCSSGRCVCPGGRTLCSGSCVETSNDTRNCGGCGTTCGTNENCMGGACVCPGPHYGRSGSQCLPSCGHLGTLRALPTMCCGMACAGGAAGAAFDCPNCCPNAAACGCPSGQSLCGGVCRDTRSDPNNCGGCGVRCTTGTAPDCCNSVCVDTDRNRMHCGGCSLPCDTLEICSFGICNPR